MVSSGFPIEALGNDRLLEFREKRKWGNWPDQHNSGGGQRRRRLSISRFGGEADCRAKPTWTLVARRIFRCCSTLSRFWTRPWARLWIRFWNRSKPSLRFRLWRHPYLDPCERNR